MFEGGSVSRCGQASSRPQRRFTRTRLTIANVWILIIKGTENTEVAHFVILFHRVKMCKGTVCNFLRKLACWWLHQKSRMHVKFRIKDFSRHSLASRTRRSAGFQSWIKAEEMSVCSSSSPTYLQDFEHIMNLGETQMTPCPLIPFIPQSKRTRTLSVPLSLHKNKHTHRSAVFCIIHPLIQETSAPLSLSIEGVQAALMMNALTAQLIISGSFDKTDLHLYP